MTLPTAHTLRTAHPGHLFLGLLYPSTNSHSLSFRGILNSLFDLGYSILCFQSLLQWNPTAFRESKYVWRIKT